MNTSIDTSDVRTAISPIEILLVEDNPADVRLTFEALGESKVRNRLVVAGDGVEAMARLRQQHPYEKASLPDLILLDLNLPKMDGREVLEAIKSDAGLKHIPVVVLTTSRAEEDMLRTYQLHANAFVTKPVDLEQFLKVVASIEEFWLAVVKLIRVERG